VVNRARDGPGEEAATGLRPGALTALLEQMARTPAGGEEAPVELLRAGDLVAGRFELVRPIGRGGFGVVFEARDRQLGRLVALKAVRAGDREALRERLLRGEGEAAARLSHPNIVAVHDLGRDERGAFLVMELLHGRTLAERLADGPLAAREALRIATEVARGVAHAHGHGVVHRDLKPANVFLCEDGQVKVLDFGLSHALGRRGAEGGTPAYMAPEQLRGAPEDERTDVFALGVLLFEMLAGRTPFPTDDGGKALLSARLAPALEVPEAPALGPLLARMLAKDPVNRPRDGAEVLRELEACTGGAPAAGATPGPVRVRRRALRLGALVVASLAVGVGLALAISSWRRAPPQAAKDGRVLVAVADFANQTGEKELDGLSGLLITSLEQSRLLSVLTRGRMLDLARQAGHGRAERIDEVLGRELGRKAGARALLLLAIHRFDQMYALDLRALDPVRDEYLFSLKEQATSKAELLGAIDRMSERARQALRETPAAVEASRVKVAEAATASFEAYEHYFRGQQQEERTRYQEAIVELRAAVAADPGFALAHYRIAYLGEFVGLEAPERAKHIEAAVANSGKVGEKERLLIRAWQAHMEKRNDEAHRLYAQAVGAWPQEKEVLYMAADLYFHEGQTETALPLFERALQLDPSWEPALVHVWDCLAELGKGDELLAVARRWAEKSPGPISYRSLALALARDGKLDEALERARRAFEMEQSYWTRGALAEVLLHRGDFEEAQSIAEPVAADGSRNAKERAHAIAITYCALALQGRPREALRVLEPLREIRLAAPAYHEIRMVHFLGDGAPDRARGELAALVRAFGEAEAEGRLEPKKMQMLPVVAVLAGDLARAAELARFPDAGSTREALYRGVVAWRSGRLEEAASTLRPLAEGHEDFRQFALYALGEVAAARGRHAEAVEALERFQRAFGGGYFRTWAYPRSLVLEAGSLEALGRQGEARAKAQRLLSMWQRAEPDLPRLAEAKALCARLGCPAR